MHLWSALCKGLIKAEPDSKQLSLADESVPKSASDDGAGEAHCGLQQCTTCHDPQEGVHLILQQLHFPASRWTQDCCHLFCAKGKTTSLFTEHTSTPLLFLQFIHKS